MSRRNTRRTGKAPRPIWRGLVRLFLATVTTAGLATGAIYGWQCLKESPRFSVQQIEVSGLQRATRAEVLAHAGVKTGDSILAAPLDAISLRLRQHPWIRSAIVRRVLPDTLRIDVEEFEAALVVSLGDLYLASASGHVFKRLDVGDELDLPVLTGVARDALSADADAAAETVRDAAALVHAVGSELGLLEEVHVDDVLGWSTVSVLDGAPLMVHLGADGAPRIASVLAALRTLRQAGLRPSVLWADHPTQPGRIQVRLGDDTSASFSSSPRSGARGSGGVGVGSATASVARESTAFIAKAR